MCLPVAVPAHPRIRAGRLSRRISPHRVLRVFIPYCKIDQWSILLAYWKTRNTPGGANVGANVAANPKKPSPGQDPRVGWYCYRETHSRRSHLTYTHRKSSYRPKEYIFWEKNIFAELAEQYIFSYFFYQERRGCERRNEVEDLAKGQVLSCSRQAVRA